MIYTKKTLLQSSGIFTTASAHRTYEKLVQRYSGLSIYIAKADSVIRSARDEKIRRDFNGYNFKFLVNKYNLSERTIRSITAEIRQEKQNAPIEGQITFDEI